MELKLSEVRKREEIQAEMAAKREAFLSLREGNHIEVSFFSEGRGYKGKAIVYRGHIYQITPNHLTLAFTTKRERQRRESVKLVDYLTGRCEIKKLEGGIELRINRPPKEELELKLKELGSVTAVAKHYRTSYVIAKGWFRYYGIETKSREKKIIPPQTLEPTPPVTSTEPAPAETPPPAADMEPKTENNHPNLPRIKWFKDNLKSQEEIFLQISLKRIRISSGATKLMNLEAGKNKIMPGIDEEDFSILYIMEDPEGSKAYAENSGSAVCISHKVFIDFLISKGWPVPCRVPVDLIDGMLVGRRPEIEAGERVS